HFVNQMLTKNPYFYSSSSHINNNNGVIWHFIQFTFTRIVTGVDVGTEFITISSAPPRKCCPGPKK
ncbi:TPA: hypothetical protein ACIPDD_004695, partial [Salmonella enterica subsp. enterica serovar Wangata]